MSLKALNTQFDIATEGHFKNPVEDVASQYSVYEGHDLVKGGNVITQPNTKAVSNDTLRGIVDVSWLPWAAEYYNISPNIADYVIVPVEIIRSDLPNRNGIAFPAEELLRFGNSDIKQQAYMTWIGQGTYYEHQENNIPNKAKGVIISVAVRKLEGVQGDFIKLLHLLAFDRKKDPTLAKDITERRRTGYSMGSSCETYTCSICQADMRIRGYCDHIDVRTKKAKANMRLLGNRLAFPQSRYIRGFECSSVATPAYFFAKSSAMLTG